MKTAKVFINAILDRNLDKESTKRKIENNNHPDLLWIEPSYMVQGKSISQEKAKSENISIKSPSQIRLNQIKEIIEFLGKKPLESKRSIVIIEDIERKSYGTLFYCLSLFILIFLFWDKDPYALITGFFIMTFGDVLAGLIGKSFNSKSWIIFKQKKSLFGTLTMFLTSLIIVCSIGYAQQNNLNLNYFSIAFFATLLEQFSVLGIDNFIVPISSALCFNFFYG